MTWLLEARRWIVWQDALDLRKVPRSTKKGTRLPHWWAMRKHAAKEYCERYVAGADPSQGGEVERIALPALTTYLLALECMEGAARKRRALSLLESLAAAEHLPEDLNNVAERVIEGALVPHETWLGELEWALLDLAGVVWPDYVVSLAEFGPDHIDELEREIGGRLRNALRGGTLRSAAGEWDERTAIRHCRWALDSRPKSIRHFLMDIAGHAVADSARNAAQRADAAIGVIGLALLLAREGSDLKSESARRALRAVGDSIDPDGPLAPLAQRLLRHPEDAALREVEDLFWETASVQSADAEKTAQRVPPKESAALGPGGAWIETSSGHYEFAKPLQRSVIEVLWELVAVTQS